MHGATMIIEFKCMSLYKDIYNSHNNIILYYIGSACAGKDGCMAAFKEIKSSPVDREWQLLLSQIAMLQEYSNEARIDSTAMESWPTWLLMNLPCNSYIEGIPSAEWECLHIQSRTAQCQEIKTPLWSWDTELYLLLVLRTRLHHLPFHILAV